MRASLVLCDYAQATPDGKLTIVGGGWNITGPNPATFGIGILIHVDWNQANRRHTWRLEFFNEDGETLKLPGPAGEQEIVIETTFEVGRPPGVPPGTEFFVPGGLNFSALPLPPGRRFVVKLSIDGHSEDGWQEAFNTRPLGSAATGQALPPPE